MAKRKCVRQAIIEISDSDDDEIIADNSHLQPDTRNNAASPDITSMSEDDIEVIERSQVSNEISLKKESRLKTNNKKRKSDNNDVIIVASKVAKNDETTDRSDKKTNLQSGNAKMGLAASKSAEKSGKRILGGITAERPKIFKGDKLTKEVRNRRKKTLPQYDSGTLQPTFEAFKANNVAATAVSAGSEGKFCDTSKPYLASLAERSVSCVEWTDVDYIQETHGIHRNVAENIVKLFQEDNTVPFIARYRRNMTRGMSADELRLVKNSYERSKLIKQKASAVIKEIDRQGKWTPEFHAFVHSTKSLSDLDHIQSMFKVTKSTLAERARSLGLSEIAIAIMEGKKVNSLNGLVEPRTEGLKTEEQVRDGIVCILADTMNKDKNTFEIIKDLRSRYTMMIETTARHSDKIETESNKQKDDKTKYDLYHNFSSLETHLKPHQILAINRGESRKILSVKITMPPFFEQDFKGYCARRYEQSCAASPLHRNLLTAAFDHVWNKSIKSSITRRTRHELNERAEVASMDVFAENVKQLLLTPPVRGKIVLGIDPGFRHGCKLAVVSERGDVLTTATIFPNDSNNPKATKDAQSVLAGIVLKHKCTVFALGNGTACRETEMFLARLIKQRAFEPLDVVYTIVDETGASIYSCSREASAEFPELDINVVSAISIARRLQDPMAELVKIEPKHLGVGMYQHDLPEKQLAAKLNEVIMEAVSFVGVDVNTASESLLKRVAGLGDSKTKHIIEWRKSSGPFRSRNDLKKVPRVGSKTFEQCAGFIRIMPETAVYGDSRGKVDSFNYLDQTWIHPESYDAARALISSAKCRLSDIGTKPFISAIKLYAEKGYEELAKKFDTSVETMKIIVEGLSMEKGQDIRVKADKSMFRKSLTSFDDLKVGTVLTGVVRNNTHFGAFVDVGVEKSGLIHKSQMGGMTLTVGQRVEAKVQSVEKERGRLSLALIRCF